MKVAQYLEDFPNYFYTWNSSSPFSKIGDNPQREHILLFSNTMTIHRKEFEKILSQYYIAELFELSNYFLGSASEPYMFLRIVDTPVDSVKVSFYNKAPHVFNDDGETFGYNSIFRAEKYTDEFGAYLDLLDSWIQTGVMPQYKNDIYEFRTIPSNEISRDFVYTRYYQRHNDKIRELLRGETICHLSDVADIESAYIPANSTQIARILCLEGIPTYPYIPDKDSIEYPATNIRLQKGDIIAYKDDYFLFYQDAEIEIYAPPCSKVIRTKMMSPEYLYIYLTSKVARHIQSAFSVKGGNALTPKPLKTEDIPVVTSTLDEQVYKDQFNQLAKPERIYEFIEVTTESEIAALLKQECINKLKRRNIRSLKELIVNDFIELKVCYEHKAYKATTILAGSLLEAFVIDWVSEFDGSDYFAVNLRYIDADGKNKAADFNRYIEELGARLGPSWDGMKELAHRIRRKRNSVHAKVSLDHPDNVTPTSCAQTIKDLEAIIKSRNINLLP